MSGIVIVAQMPSEDVRAWLDRNGLTLEIAQTKLGWTAKFREPTVIEGTSHARASGSDPQTEAARFLGWLSGARIQVGLDEFRWVPPFTGIEEAVAAATREVRSP